MDKDVSMPWDNEIITDYQQYEKSHAIADATIGENISTVYGQGKPKRTCIIGDITSDSN